MKIVNTLIFYKFNSLVCTIVSLVLLVNAFLSLIIFYHAIMKACTSLHGTTKIIMIKMCVGLIVLQGLIVQFMTMDGTTGQNDDPHFTAGVSLDLQKYCLLLFFHCSYPSQEKAERIYFFVVLIEYAIVSVLFIWR